MKSQRCICCGTLDYQPNAMGYEPFTDGLRLCGFCLRRGRLCQHNLFERVTAGGENVAFSSRPEPTLVRLENGVLTREPTEWRA